MTEHYSKNITPDSITGMIFALEGIKNAVVLLNGPMGCKFYHSTTSQFLIPRPPLYLPADENGEKVPVDYNFLNNWFFRQSRVPCTYLDGYDYVYGTGEKVEAGLKYLKENISLELLAIVNSPGASLIGDNLKELAQKVFPDIPVVLMESPGYSREFCDGYEEAVLKLMDETAQKFWKNGNDPEAENMQSKKEKIPLDCGAQRTPEAGGKKFAGVSGKKSVNLLGFTIWHRNMEGDIQELKRLFSLCGIEVRTCVCAGSSVEELAHIPDADLNVVVYPELGLSPAEYLKKNQEMPYYLCPGPPVGFAATEEMFADICRLLNADAEPLMEESRRARALAWSKINGIHQMCGLPDGARFALEGTCPEVYAYSRFFMEYFGMVPDSLLVNGGKTSASEQRLRELLNKNNAGHPEEKDIMETDAELVFGNANTIAALKTRRDAFCGIEISQPGMGYVDVLPKTTLGIKGSLFLTEQVLNGLMSRI